MNKKSVFITGAAGFIAFHLIKSLLEQGYIIYGIDNLCDPDFQIKIDRLSELGIYNINGETTSCKYENFTFNQLDITEPNSIHEIFSRIRFNLVIHLAAKTGVRSSSDHNIQYLNTNVHGFVNVLECCKNYNIAQFIYASSSSVYGENLDLSTENTDCNNQVSFYGVTKKTNELFAKFYYNMYGVNSVGLRFFTVYGAWGRPDMSPFIFANAIIHNQEVNLFNNGYHKRSFTFVNDLVKYINLLLKQPIREARIYNIGNTTSYSIAELISCLENCLNKTATIKLTPMQNGDVTNTKADMALFHKKYGSANFTSLQDGVNQFVDWYAEYTKELK